MADTVASPSACGGGQGRGRCAGGVGMDGKKLGEDFRMVPKDEERACRIEFRASGDGHIKGYPILFNVLSEDMGEFRERILPDAVTFDADLRADFNHNPDCILGRVLAGTLKVSTDARGVFMNVTPPATTWARDLKVSIDRGDIDQGSFSFRVLPGGQHVSEEDGQQVRTLSKILVRRVSVVSDPAYTKTSIEVRNRSTKPPQVSSGAPKQVHPVAPLSVYQRRQALFDLE
jgi:HK97 family phage prohead protease